MEAGVKSCWCNSVATSSIAERTNATRRLFAFCLGSDTLVSSTFRGHWPGGLHMSEPSPRREFLGTIAATVAAAGLSGALPLRLGAENVADSGSLDVALDAWFGT